MVTFSVAVDDFKGCFRNWRLWLLQFFLNPLLFGLFTLWLLLPVANAFHVTLNVLVAIILFAAILVLHAGMLNYFYSQSENEVAPLRKAFASALRNLLPVILCAVVLYLFFQISGKVHAYEETFPPYLRSMMPAFLRRQVGLSMLQEIFDAVLFVLNWVLVPGLIFPFLASAAHSGFRGLGRRGFAAWKSAVLSPSYWVLLLLGALVGVLATQKIMGMTPDFSTSTYAQERTSLIFRASVSYLLGLWAWMLVCSVVGRRAGKSAETSSDLSGQAGG